MTVTFPTLELRGRDRFSSSDSARNAHGRQEGGWGPLRHSLWLPDTDPGSDPRGLLLAAGHLDHRGKVREGLSPAVDRSYYRAATALATMHYDGFGPILEATGLNLTYGVRPYLYDKEYFVKVAFPDTKTVAALGNAVLEKTGADLRFAVLTPGMYSGGNFIDLMAEGIYPLSECHKTPDKEVDENEYGAHDIIVHAAAVMAAAQTRTIGHVRTQARALQDGSAFAAGYDEEQRERIRGRFMRHTDDALNVPTFAGLLNGEQKAEDRFSRMLGVSYNEQAQCAAELCDNIRQPLSHGFLRLAGEVV